MRRSHNTSHYPDATYLSERSPDTPLCSDPSEDSTPLPLQHENRSLCKSRHTSCRSPYTPLPPTDMFSLKTLFLAGVVVGATAFAPMSMSTPELRFATPRICTRGNVMARSMAGDGTTTLTRQPVESGGSEALLREKLGYPVWIREDEWKSGGQGPDSWPHQESGTWPPDFGLGEGAHYTFSKTSFKFVAADPAELKMAARFDE